MSLSIARCSQNYVSTLVIFLLVGSFNCKILFIIFEKAVCLYYTVNSSLNAGPSIRLIVPRYSANLSKSCMGSKRLLNLTYSISKPGSNNLRNMSIDIGGMRIKYKDKDETFLEKHLVSKEPYGQFKAWFEEACSRKEILEPNAMCLATVSKDGFPSARFVLCKGYGKDGFKFFTNYGSRKAGEMDGNPNVAATFYWEILNRSVRIEGCVEKLNEAESTKYFHSRPVLSQIAACTSFQSTPIESRDILCERETVLEAEYIIPGKEVPKPSFWGGYIIRPRAVEFWQGQRDRLHDRIKFRKPNEGEVPNGKLLHEGEDGWVYERLSP